MPKLVTISAKKLLKLFLKNGYEILRIRGSHHFIFNKNLNKTTCIPIHGNENVGVGLLRTILRDIEMAVEDFDKLRLGK
jgi:predicted RNA binding protein YcfA (HicA-like mRNA interferase family)